MARKRTSETELAVSQNTAAAPARRKTASPQRKKHTPVTAVAETVAEPAKEFGGIAAASAYQPTHEDIAALAYSYWVARGYQGGTPEEDWLRAEQELGLAVTAVNA